MTTGWEYLSLAGAIICILQIDILPTLANFLSSFAWICDIILLCFWDCIIMRLLLFHLLEILNHIFQFRHGGPIRVSPLAVFPLQRLTSEEMLPRPSPTPPSG